jgi:hypothetical protein
MSVRPTCPDNIEHIDTATLRGVRLAAGNRESLLCTLEPQPLSWGRVTIDALLTSMETVGDRVSREQHHWRQMIIALEDSAMLTAH